MISNILESTFLFFVFFSHLRMVFHSVNKCNTKTSKWDFYFMPTVFSLSLCLFFGKVVHKHICCNWKRVVWECIIDCLGLSLYRHCNWVWILYQHSCTHHMYIVYSIRERHSKVHIVYCCRSNERCEKRSIEHNSYFVYTIESCACSWHSLWCCTQTACTYISLHSHTRYTYTWRQLCVGVHSHLLS